MRGHVLNCGVNLGRDVAVLGKDCCDYYGGLSDNTSYVSNED